MRMLWEYVVFLIMLRCGEWEKDLLIFGVLCLKFGLVEVGIVCERMFVLFVRLWLLLDGCGILFNYCCEMVVVYCFFGRILCVV